MYGWTDGWVDGIPGLQIVFDMLLLIAHDLVGRDETGGRGVGGGEGEWGLSYIQREGRAKGLSRKA